MVNSSIKNADIEARGQSKPPLADADLLALLQKMIKQRQESVELYDKGNRPELSNTALAAMALSTPSSRSIFSTGLTHLLAVSGTNLTLVVGFLLVLARWCGVRGRWNHLVGAVGIIGFVLLAGTEPSVLRRP